MVFQTITEHVSYNVLLHYIIDNVMLIFQGNVFYTCITQREIKQCVSDLI